MQSKEKEDRYVANYRVRPVLNVRSFSAKDGRWAKKTGQQRFVCLFVFCCVVPGGGVQEGHTRGRPHAARAALPLRLPLLQQRHRAALSGPDASFHQDVPRISR